MNKSLFNWFLLFLCNLMWAMQFTCIKLVQDQVGPIFTVWGPMLLATILLIPFLKKDPKQRKKLTWADLKTFISLALLGAFPAQVIITWGTQLSLASNASIITLSLPVITAVFAFIILKEKMNLARWISFVIAIIGVSLCALGDFSKLDFGSSYAWGNLLIFIAILGNAYYNTICKKISNDYSEIEMLFYSYVTLIVILTPFVLFLEMPSFENIPSYTPQTWVGLALLTVFHNFLSMILFFKALKVLDVTQAGLSNYLITFLGLPIAAIFLGEKLTGLAIIGGILVFVGTLITTIWEHKINKKSTIDPVHL
ncbi:MAG TPA: DMT family transporter [Cytophagaceae bacterium]